ncbi:biotin/lipoyl-containing protein [Mycobacteroides abscessus]|uniref:biotin/lipoyl-containing protein n=1 Tax=Mycobacteroides abscessus TaxID=36809 RepID=UPI000C257276
MQFVGWSVNRTTTIECLRDLGHGMEEALLVRWYIAEGDEVAADEAILEIETDKATVEYPCTVSGRVTKLLKNEREIVRVGDSLCLIVTDQT